MSAVVNRSGPHCVVVLHDRTMIEVRAVVIKTVLSLCNRLFVRPYEGGRTIPSPGPILRNFYETKLTLTLV